MVELDGLIYVLGGENDVIELITVEVFDPHFSTWKMQTSMTMIRKVQHTLTLCSQKSRTCYSARVNSKALDPYLKSTSSVVRCTVYNFCL